MFAFLHESGPNYIDGHKQAPVREQFAMGLGIVIGILIISLWHGPVEPQQEEIFWFWDWMGILGGSLYVVILTWWGCVGVRQLIK